MADFLGRLSPDADTITGTAADEFVEVPSNVNSLQGNDIIDGGAGFDQLLFERTGSVAISEAILVNVTGIEEFDVSAASDVYIRLDNASILQSDTDVLRLTFGNTPLTLDMRGVTPGTGQVELWGSGPVTLSRDVDQEVFVGAFGGDATVTGSVNADTIHGGAGDDAITGGTGNDLLISTGGNDTFTGGADADRFIIEDAGARTVTITDFAGRDQYETIDLRDFGAIGFDDLTITANGGGAQVALPGGTTLVLDGVAPGTLQAEDFIFAPQDAARFFTLSGGLDNFQGGSGPDVFEWIGSIDQFTPTDSLVGGAGVDTLRVFGNDRVIGAAQLGTLDGVEVIDLRAASGDHAVELSPAVIAQSNTGALTIRFGAGDLALNAGTVADAGQVILDGAGAVTLAEGTPGQKVSIADSADGTVTAGNAAVEILGGAGNDDITGSTKDDTLSGGGGNDVLRGVEGNNILSGGSGNDHLIGGAGNDILRSGSGANRLEGGGGFDQLIIEAGAQGTVITDYDIDNLATRIYLTELDGLSSVADLSFANEGANVRVTGAGLDLLLEGVQANQLGARDFLFDGQDPLAYSVSAGTTETQLQSLFDGALPGAVIDIAAGTYTITEGLRIPRGDITVRGAGEGETIFRTEIGLEAPASTLRVTPDDLLDRYGQIGSDVVEGSNQVQLPDMDALRAANPDQGFEDFEVGDLLFLFQPNDEEFLRASGNLDNPDRADWNIPVHDETVLSEAERFYLREFRSRIESIDENGVATLAEASPFTFEAGTANLGKSTFLSNVHLSDFSIQGTFESITGGAPDPYLFENTIPEWASVPALDMDGVRDSSLARITITDPAAHAFAWQRSHETTADSLTAIGAHNKDGSSGYHFVLQESFANDFDNLSSTGARHAVLFASFDAEHYNDIHLSFTDRDINFHGSPDSDNTVVVDRMEQDYPVGVFPQWQAVHPGVPGIHPVETIEDNDVTFRFATMGDRANEVTAHPDGGNITGREGADLILGQGGDDTLSGGLANDTIRGGGGDDIINGGVGQDELFGDAGNDTINGGADNDTISGGDGNDLLIGGQGLDELTGGSGRDTFRHDTGDQFSIVQDFEAGAGGDIVEIRGTAYDAFSDLRMSQVGADVHVHLGREATGSDYARVELLNTQLNTLVADNFAFGDDGGTAHEIALRGNEFFGLGTDLDDVFTIGRVHLENDTFEIQGGLGHDMVVVGVGFLTANLGATGRYAGVDEFDFSGGDGALDLRIDSALVAQSDADRLTLALGDSGTPTLLDTGGLADAQVVLVDGAREVRLGSDSDQSVGITDRVGGTIIGGDRDDRIEGGAGNDTFTGGAGNDTLIGGGGQNTAVYSGARGDYDIAPDDAGNLIVTDQRGGGDGTDTLRQIQTLQFSDGTVDTGDFITDVTLAGQVTDTGGTALPGASLVVIDAGGATLDTLTSDAAGRFSTTLPDGEAARLDASRDYDPGTDPAISALDALDVLRLAVGLAPSFGPAQAQNYIAADINTDGAVTALDALEVLRAAVGLESTHAPEWVFFDATTDWDSIPADRAAVNAPQTGIDLSAVAPGADLGLTGILLGNMESV